MINDDIFQMNSMKIHMDNSFMYDDYLKLKIGGHSRDTSNI